MDTLSALPLDSPVISLNPQLIDVNTSRPVDGLFQENSFQVCSLNILFRNSAQIVKFYKGLGYGTLNSCISVTVEGTPSIFQYGNFEQYSVYQTALEALTNNKFVCVYEEKFKREMFL